MSEINRGILISFMKKGLKQQKEGSFGDLLRLVMQKLLEAKIVRYDRVERIQQHGYHVIASDDKRIGQQFCECYAWLLFNGMIIPEPGIPNFLGSNSWNFYCLTDYGRQWIENEDEQLPEYEDGYIHFLKSSINNIDNIVIQYISESIRTFNNNHIFSSAVMLGASAEKLFYLLAIALCDSSADALFKKYLQKELDRRDLPSLRDGVSKKIDELIQSKKIPYSIHEGLKDSVFSLFNTIRIQRNDAVHPLAVKISREQLRLLLVAFPHVCKKAYDFISWLKANKT